MSNVPCDVSLDELISRDVFGSGSVQLIDGQQDGFELDENNIIVSCQEDQINAVETFCNIPGQTFLDSTVCNLSLQTNQPDGFFERLTRGDIQHPDQMRGIFESAHFDQNTVATQSAVPWITVLNTPHVESKTEDYVGFRGMNQAFQQDLAVSNNSDAMLVIDNGKLYENQSDGLLRSTPGVSGLSDVAARVICSSSARIRVAMFTNKLFAYFNGTWNDVSETSRAKYGNVRMFEKPNEVHVVVFYATATTVSSQWNVKLFRFSDLADAPQVATPLVPYMTFQQQAVDTLVTPGFLALSDDNVFIVCCTFPSKISNTMDLHLLNIQTGAAQYGKWQFVSHDMAVYMESIPDAFRCDSILDGTLATAFECLMNINEYLIQFQLIDPNNLLVAVELKRQFRAVRICENLTHAVKFVVYNDQIYTNARLTTTISIANQFDLTNTRAYIFAMTPDSLDVWIYYKSDLFRLRRPLLPLAWTNSFSLFFADHAKISDLGSPQFSQEVANTYVPGMHWFLGTSESSKDFPLQASFPVEVVRSHHQMFRLALTAPTRQTSPLRTFVYATASLQRANEYGQFVQPEVAKVILFNDGNVQALNSDDVPLWESNTHDRGSSNADVSQEFKFRELPHAVVSSNGLYILYLANNFRVRLVNNSFNNARFATWCSQDPERFGKAIDMQSNLCWNSLKIPDSVNFADPRCACVGDSRLFDAIAPSASNIPQGLLAPIAQNLPCLANGCAQSFHLDDAPTNVHTLYQQRCYNRIFNVCQEVFQIGTDVNLINVGFLKLQNCTLNNFQTCKDDKQCGPGMKCFNGQCVTSCTSNNQCKAITGSLIQAKCVNGHCEQSTKPNSKSMIFDKPMIVLIAITSFLLVFLFIAVLVLGLKNRSR